MVNSFQFTRSARLILAYRQTKKAYYHTIHMYEEQTRTMGVRHRNGEIEGSACFITNLSRCICSD